VHVETSDSVAPLPPSVARGFGTSYREADPFIAHLALRERYRDRYWSERDPIIADRLLWRAQTLRHTVHLLPGQTILELGCGEGRFTTALRGVTRGENPITAVTFQQLASMSPQSHYGTEHVVATALPGPLAGRQFDCIVAMDLLDRSNSSDLLSVVHALLAPGGEVLFYESNPWNPVHQLRAAFARLIGRPDPRSLLPRPRLYELLSEIGFIRVYSVFNDFVFSPLTPRLIWFFRNLSILLENAPGVACLAGSILVHGQRPPRKKEQPAVSLFRHEALRNAVSVVIPAHNEEGNVEALVSTLLTLYGDYIGEVVIVNDNSTDGTAAAIERIQLSDSRVKAVHRSRPNGVGRAITDGFRTATGRYVLTMDCDFQHLLPELRDLFDAAAEGHDVVVGSRFSRHSVLLNYPFAKILANRAFHTLARMLLGHHFRDVTNNLKLLKREVVADLQLQQPGFAINAETGLQPYLLGYRVQEVPISWINRTPGMGTSSFRLVKVGGGYWRVLLGLWMKRLLRRGPYCGLRRKCPPPDAST
jgi:dolichol-phosphate mannosyltransferase